MRKKQILKHYKVNYSNRSNILRAPARVVRGNLVYKSPRFTKTPSIITYIYPMFLINVNSSCHAQQIKILGSLTSFSPQTSHFSSTSRHFLAARRSPQVRTLQAKQRQQQQRQQQQSQTGPLSAQVLPSTFRRTSSRWPTDLLKHATQSGQLAMSAEVAEAVLNDFERLNGLSAGKSICSGMVRAAKRSYMRLAFFICPN